MQIHISELGLENNKPIKELLGYIQIELECQLDILNNKVRYVLEDKIIFDSYDLWDNRMIVEVYIN